LELDTTRQNSTVRAFGAIQLGDTQKKKGQTLFYPSYLNSLGAFWEVKMEVTEW